MSRRYLTALAFAALMAACVLLLRGHFSGEDVPETPEPYAPVLTGYESFQTTCPEISGLCFAPDGRGLLAASDENGLYRVSFTGETEPFFNAHMDCEGVTLDPATGDVYYIIEGKQELRRLKGPAYDASELIHVFGDVGLNTNRGLEGVSWYGNGVIFVGNQKRPNLLMQYSVTEDKILGGQLTETSEIGDLYYDPVRDMLWIMDSDAFTINLCTLEGKILQSWNIPFIANAEGVCVDHERGCVWVGDDTTNRIFKFSFEGL